MISFVATFFVSSLCMAVPHNPNPWKEVDQIDYIKIWAREVPGSNVREVKAETIMSIPAKRLWQVLNEVEKYVEFMPYLTEGRILGPAGPNSHYEYQLLDPPIVDRRDYTVKVTMEEDPQTGEYRRSWELANSKGPKEKDGVVRVPICEGAWEIKQLGSQSSLVKYFVHTDPGGIVPAWIANKANTVSLPDLMHALKSRAKDPNWMRD